MPNTMKKFYDEIWRDITALGGVVITTITTLIIFILDFTSLFFQLMISLAAAYLIGILTRQLYFKERPKIEPYSGWIQKIYASSFPSIHALRSWAMITVSILYFENVALTITLMLAGAAISYSRIYLDKHHLADVVVGSIAGTLIGLAVVIVV